MSFTDDDLKRLKEMITDTRALWINDRNLANPLLALIDRLEAAEKLAWLVKRFVERQEHAPDCRCDFCWALKTWRELAGK